MSSANPDQIVAHVDLLRAVDRLLTDAEVVRQKREVLDRLLSSEPTEGDRPDTARDKKGHGHAR
jgi:hypothetical protein